MKPLHIREAGRAARPFFAFLAGKGMGARGELVFQAPKDLLKTEEGESGFAGQGGFSIPLR